MKKRKKGENLISTYEYCQGSPKIKILDPMLGVRRTKLFRAQTPPIQKDPPDSAFFEEPVAAILERMASLSLGRDE